MSRVSAERMIRGVSAFEAERLWCDTERWPEFVDGLERVESADPGFPRPGSVVAWRSFPAGRGRVRETVVEYLPGRQVASRVEDDYATAEQQVTFDGEPGGARVSLELDYEIRRRGAFTALTDLLFVRRAQADSLRRTLAGLDQALDGRPA